MSKRLGIYTGHVYNGSERKPPQECCAVLNEQQEKSVAQQNALYFVLHTKCKGCKNCGESRKT